MPLFDTSGLNALLPTAAPQADNPVSATDSGYMADVANQYWNAHPDLTPDQVLLTLPQRNSNFSNNQFALTVDPKTGRFVPAATQTAPVQSLNDLVAFQGTALQSPVQPEQKAGIVPGSFLGKIQEAGTTLAQDAGTGINEALANIKYWKQTHETVPAQPLSADQMASVRLMGVNNPGTLAGLVDTAEHELGMQGFPIVPMKDGSWTVGPTTKVPVSVIDKNIKNYVAQRGGSLDDLNRRAAETADPNSAVFDPGALFVQMHANILQSITNPAYKNSVLLDNINLVAKARQVIASPDKYSKQQVKEAQGIVDYWKQNAGKGIWSGTKDLIKSFVDNPAGTVKSLAGGIASTPELAEIGGAATRLGSVATGASINAGLDYLQQEGQQGFARNLGSSALTGGLIGLVGGGHGKKLTKAETLADGVTPDTRLPGERIPGEPLPASTPNDTSHNVAYVGAGNSSGLITHLDKSMPQYVKMPNRSGQPVDVDIHQTIPYHERVEMNLMHPDQPAGEAGLLKVIQRMGRYVTEENMTPKIKQDIINGVPLSYQDAHEIAQASEHEMIDSTYDIDNKTYDKHLKPLIDAVIAKAKKNPDTGQPPGIDTKPYDDMGHSEEVATQGVSGGPTGTTGGPNASHPELERAGFLQRNKEKLVGAGIASGLGSLAASTLNQPGDSTEQKLGRAALGSLAGLGLFAGMDRFGNDIGQEPFQRGMLFGPRSHMFDPVQANEAREMMFKGMSPEDIYRRTGIFVDREGSMHMEATDHKMSIPAFDKTAKDVPLPYNDVVHGSGFQEAYPEEAAKTKIVLDTEMPKHGLGMYDPRTKTVYLNANKPIDSVLGTLSHENQHIGQELEGDAQGSGPDFFYDRIMDEKHDLWQQYQIARSEAAMHEVNGRSEQAQEAAQRAKELSSNPLFNMSDSDAQQQANRLYRNTYGEGMAEATRIRRWWTPEMRRAVMPMVDIPKGEAVFLHGSDIKIYHQEPSIEDSLKTTGEMDEDGRVPSLEAIGNKHPQEADLVRLAKQGNPKAITDLYNYYKPIITRTVRGMIKSSRGRIGSALGHTEEDIAQQALTEGIRQLPEFEGRSSFYTFLHSIARNLALKAVRDARNKPELTSEVYRPGTNPNIRTDAGTGDIVPAPLIGDVSFAAHSDMGERPAMAQGIENIPSQELSPPDRMQLEEQEARASEASDALHQAMDKLDPKLRQVIIDHDLNGMRPTDIARKEGVTEGAIRKRILTAHSALKYALGNGAKARYLDEGGFATPEALKNLFKYGVLPFAGATLGMSLSSDEHKLRGAIWGAIAALSMGRIDPVRTMKNIRFIMAHPDTPDISMLTSGYQGLYKGIIRDGYQTISRIKQLVPDPARREELTHFIEGKAKTSLTPAERQAVKLATDFYARHGQRGLDAGVLKQLLPGFVNHEWLSDRGDWTRHNLHRNYKSYQEGMDAGLVPKSLDITDLIHWYARDIGQAIASKHLFNGLRSFATDLDGNTAVMDANKAPHDYRPLNHPMFRGKLVNPNILNPLEFIYQHPYSTVVQALNVLNSSIKRLQLGLSLFHPFTLGLVHLTMRPFFADGGMLRSIKEIGQSAVGKTEMQKLYAQGGYGDIIDLANRAGVEYTAPGKGDIVDQDVNNGLYAGLDGLENFLQGFPIAGKPLASVVRGGKNVFHLSDKFVWENMHAGLKLQLFTYLFNTAKMNWLRAAAKDPSVQVPSDLQLARQMAGVVNNADGGLNWRQTVEDSNTRLGRALSYAINNPDSRAALQLAVFAMDWTESTLRTFFGMFGKGSGLSGILHPKMPADFYRMYHLRNALLIGTLYNAFNMMTTGHPIWDNKGPNGEWEPFNIQLGNGESIQPNKHFFEAPNLIKDTFSSSPFQWELNKMGWMPKETLEQALNMQYLAPEAPSIKNRGAHLAENLVPITAKSYKNQGSLASFLSLFMQVSHHSKQSRSRRKKADIDSINSQIGGQ